MVNLTSFQVVLYNSTISACGKSQVWHRAIDLLEKLAALLQTLSLSLFLFLGWEATNTKNGRVLK